MKYEWKKHVKSDTKQKECHEYRTTALAIERIDREKMVVDGVLAAKKYDEKLF